ncbi:MAG: hypothetical protein ACFFCM_09945 [Promethearchaeota archaeon]
MSEILEFLNKNITEKKAANSEIIKNIIEKIVELNLEDMAKNLPDILFKLGTLLEINNNIKDLSDIFTKNLSIFIQKLLTDKEIKYELSLTPDVRFNLSIGNKTLGVEIKEGNLNFRSDAFKPPDESFDFSVEVPLNLIPKLFTGEENLMVELMAGERIKLWREKQPYNAEKLFELMPLLSIALEKLNLDKWL